MRNTCIASYQSLKASFHLLLRKIILIVSRLDDLNDLEAPAPAGQPQPSATTTAAAAPAPAGQPQSSATTTAATAAAAPAPAGQPQPSATTTAAAARNLDWANLVVMFCSSVGVEMADTQDHPSKLPLSSFFLGLAVLLAFACIMVSKFVQHSKCPRIIIHLFHLFGVFFGITAFFISITIPFPLWFKCTASVIYVASGLVVIFCNCFYK